MSKTEEHNGDLSVVLTGEAGQGIKSVEMLLTRILKSAGFNVFATKEYMSRIRGGSNSTQIRASSRRGRALVDRIDLLMPLTGASIDRLRSRVTQETIILGEGEDYGEGLNVIHLPLSKLAGEIGGGIYANTIAASTVTALLAVPKDLVEANLKRLFAKKGEAVVDKNLLAAQKGYELGARLLKEGKFSTSLSASEEVANEILMSGIEAVSLGAIAGGCNFVSSYPMSPSTGVLTFLAQHAHEFGIGVEQVEDEIAAINMALGVWYAGGRAIVTTSGGGFALMGEGISLSGMLETPVVIHLAQRPGPATGLPTRTEQGDLNLALYAGHGDFPRVLLAPGTTEEAFDLTRRAFDLADRYQVPVVILTDQYFVDSYYNLPYVDVSEVGAISSIVSADSGYRRYEITDNGISPRGVPGFGEGVVSVDSDEHDEVGHITEDLRLRTRMVEKRLRKGHGLLNEFVEPKLSGSEGFETLIIGWGSTYHVIEEALDAAGRDDIAGLHFPQVYPLHPDVEALLRHAKKRVVVEGNATGQFASLLEREFGVEIDERILKYNGLQFSVEELTAAFEEI